MKKDPKFVYEYLVTNHNAQVIDAERIVNLATKEKSVKTKTKTQLCQELYLKNKKLTTKQIAEKVGCNLSIAHRAIKSLPDSSIHKEESEVSSKNLIDFINENYKSKKQFKLEELVASYNLINKTDYTINQFNSCLKILVNKSYLSKMEKGIYAFSTNTGVVKRKFNIISSCAAKFLLEKIKSESFDFNLNDLAEKYPDLDSGKLKKVIQNWSYSKKIIDGYRLNSVTPGVYTLSKGRKRIKTSKETDQPSVKAVEVAASLYKMVGLQDSIKLLELVHSIHGK